jgi:hypothetical protein
MVVQVFEMALVFPKNNGTFSNYSFSQSFTSSNHPSNVGYPLTVQWQAYTEQEFDILTFGLLTF